MSRPVVEKTAQSKRGAEHLSTADNAPKETWQEKLRGIGRYCLDFLNPGYHLRKFVEDFKAAKHALRNRNLRKIAHDYEAFAQALRGRMFASLMVGGGAAALGPIIGTWFQYATGKVLLAFWIGIILSQVFNTLAFQIVWWLTHSSMYKWKHTGFVDRFKAFERDMLPLQWEGFRLAMIIVFISVTVLSSLLALVEHFFPQIAKVVPFPLLAQWLEIAFLHSSLLRLMGDLFERHSHKIAARHLMPLTEASE